MQDQIYSVGDLRAIIAPIAARHGVDRVYLFGSYARGEATENSDVDLRVDKGSLRGMFSGICGHLVKGGRLCEQL